MQRWLRACVSLVCAARVLALPHRAVCLLPVEEGPCRAELPRFYYNTLSQKCEPFFYGGCQGNANNFHSYQECHKTCFRIPKVPPACRLPPDQGPCRALLWRHFFNMSSMQCESFYYGGCHGNANRFSSLASCTDYCSPKKNIPVLCLDPLDSGPCSASIPRFHYNPVSRMCEEFKYSGCGGSNNNFISRQSCIDVCQPETQKKEPQRRVRRFRHSQKNTFLKA